MREEELQAVLADERVIAIRRSASERVLAVTTPKESWVAVCEILSFINEELICAVAEARTSQIEHEYGERIIASVGRGVKNAHDDADLYEGRAVKQIVANALAAQAEEIQRLKAEVERWQDFTEHQTWCAVCAEGPHDCDTGREIIDAIAQLRIARNSKEAQ